MKLLSLRRILALYREVGPELTPTPSTLNPLDMCSWPLMLVTAVLLKARQMPEKHTVASVCCVPGGTLKFGHALLELL